MINLTSFILFAGSCLENPCLNGGTCVDGESLRCFCLPGYGGHFCQTGDRFTYTLFFFNVSSTFLLFAIKNTSTCFSASDMEECEPGWEKFQGFCYHHFSRRQSWEAAEQHCRLCGGHLLSVMTPEEQDYVNGKIWIKRRFPVTIR